MKKIFLLMVLMSFSYLASAQLGIKAGTNLGVAQVEDRNADWDEDGLTVGVHAGLFGRINFWKLYLQPEAYYTFSTAQLRRNDVSVEKLDVEFHRLDVPVLLGIKLASILRINAGPFVSVNINTRAANSDRSWQEDLDDYYERTLFGWQAGTGIDIWRFTLDARYETTVGNLRNFDFQNATWDTYLPNEQKHRQFVFSLGYKFGR